MSNYFLTVKNLPLNRLLIISSSPAELLNEDLKKRPGIQSLNTSRSEIEATKKQLEIGRKSINEIIYEVGYSDVQAFRELLNGSPE